MCESCMGNSVSPGSRVRSTEDPQIGFNFLVDSFHFSVRLWMVGSREGKVIVKEFSKFFGKGRGKLWTTIRNDLVVEPKVEVDFIEKESGDPFCSDCFLGGVENYPLCKPMVDHNQERVKARGDWKVSDKIARDLLKESKGEGPDGGERWDSRVGV